MKTVWNSLRLSSCFPAIWLIPALVLLSANASADTLHLTDDTFTVLDKLGHNFGSNKELKINDNELGGEYHGYARFDLSPLPERLTGWDIEKATLRIWVEDVAQDGVIHLEIVPGAWNEETLTSGIADSFGAGVYVGTLSVTSADEGGFVTVDVTEALRAWMDGTNGNFGLALIPEGVELVVGSKETDLEHEMQIEVAVIDTAETIDREDADAAEAAARAAGDAALQGNLDAEATARSDADTAEALARTTADTANANAIADEATARSDADTTLQSDLDAEVTARSDADTAEALARTTADTANANAIADEATARSDADTTLQSDLDAEATARSDADTAEALARTTADTANASAIADEATARSDADTALQSDLDAEATARSDADTAEALARTTADTANASAIADEATARSDADTALQSDLDAEATARSDADTAEALARTTADTANASAIADEATARSDADTALQSDLGAEATTRSDADTAEALARTTADTANASAIADEATARSDADTALQSDLDAEATARSDADTALQGNLDAEATARSDADTAEALVRTTADTDNANAIADNATADAAHIANEDAHHARYTDGEAVAAMGTKSDTNPLNHERTAGLPFSDISGIATDAQIPDDITIVNAAHAARADDADTVGGIEAAALEESAEIDSDIAAHATVENAHHARYTAVEAIDAMGTKSDTNPLHHDRTESLAAPNITSGTLADARLSANVALLDSDQTFTAQKRFSDGLLLNSSDLHLRGGQDTNHGLGWHGGPKPFAAETIGGPVLWGATGGALGARQSGAVPPLENMALRWFEDQSVEVLGDLTVLGSLSANLNADQITSGAFGSARIGANAVTTNKIQGQAITQNKLAAGAVTTAKIANDAVTQSKIAFDAVDGTRITDGSVATVDIANGAVDSDKITDGGVETVDIAAGAVVQNKLAAGAVTTAKIANDAINSSKIITGGVETADIAVGAINSARITNGGVETVDIANGAVTGVKLGLESSSHDITGNLLSLDSEQSKEYNRYCPAGKTPVGGGFRQVENTTNGHLHKVRSNRPVDTATQKGWRVTLYNEATVTRTINALRIYVICVNE